MRARWEAYLSGVLAEGSQANLKTAGSDAEIIDFGKCGKQMGWTLDGEGVLTIAGTGAMEDYTIYPEQLGTDTLPENPINSSTWGNQLSNIKTVFVETGITSIGAAAFSLCRDLTKVELPTGITSLGRWCFIFCKALVEAKIPDTVVCN